ncbi:tunicamycin resistance protein [Ascosphaera aggregata]|nr:tunicamycin resistance protein [Ascosphaera aggregata]
MGTKLSLTESLTLSAIALGCLAVLRKTVTVLDHEDPLYASLALSGIGFAASYALITWCGPTFMRVGLKGKDMNKARSIEIPETMGAICAIIYVLLIIVFIPFAFYKDIAAATSGGGNKDVTMTIDEIEFGRHMYHFPHNKVGFGQTRIAASSIIILGLGDDLLDIRWRHKVCIPAFAATPMLIVYYVDFGVTGVVVPLQLQPYLGTLVDLGWMYYLYMAAISIFCPNSINMLAGVNGVEVSQSIVIAFLLIINDSLYLAPVTPYRHPATDSHLFSVYLLLPFIGVSLALWWHNWYPARVFVGDTYCYFAGMVFAVVGILGHFSKTLLLLFVPQIFNFLVSCPQLFNLLPCPRHRLPRLNRHTGKLEPSVMVFEKQPHRLVSHALQSLDYMHLVRITKNEDGELQQCTNLTLLNMWLVMFGPMKENTLATHITILQFICGIGALVVRHKMALWVFAEDNRGFGCLKIPGLSVPYSGTWGSFSSDH